MPAFVHRTAEVSKDASIGEGTSIWNEVQVREGATIGKRCRLGKSVYVDKNVTVGDDCKIQNFATLYDGVTLGKEVFVGPHARFANDLYPRARSPNWKIVKTKVMDGATIGANATVLCGIAIGRYAMVAAGAVVTEDVPDYALVMGNPARLAGHVCERGHRLDGLYWCPVCRKKIDVRPVAASRKSKQTGQAGRQS